MQENEQELSDEKKELILEDAKKYEEDLKKLEEMQSSLDSEKISSAHDTNESYNIEQERKNIQQNKQGKVINRKLGYHRRYLSSQIKLSNLVLLSIFLILSLFVAIKYISPYTFHNQPGISSHEDYFGNKVMLETSQSYDNGILTVDINITNNEQATIKINPAAIQLLSGENHYIPTVTNLSNSNLQSEGLHSEEKTSFTLSYDIEESDTKDMTLQILVKGSQQSVVIVSGVNL